MTRALVWFALGVLMGEGLPWVMHGAYLATIAVLAAMLFW